MGCHFIKSLWLLNAFNRLVILWILSTLFQFILKLKKPKFHPKVYWAILFSHFLLTLYEHYLFIYLSIYNLFLSESSVTSGNTDEASFVINIRPLNANAPTFTPSLQNSNVLENKQRGKFKKYWLNNFMIFPTLWK